MSDKIFDLIQKMDQKNDDLHLSVKATQEANDKLEAGHLEQKEAIAKAGLDAEKAIQEMQEVKQSISAFEDTTKHIEKSIARMGDSMGVDTSEMEGKASQEMSMFLRSGQELSQEVKEFTAKALAHDAMMGANDADVQHEIKTLIAGSNPDGGYFIRPERSAMMIKRIFETSPIRRFANVETTMTDGMEFIIDDNDAFTGGWIGETDDRDETATAKIGKLTIPVHEQFAQPLATQKMIDDAGFDIESWLMSKTTDKMSRTENTAFVLGDGSQKPQGFLAYPAWAVNGVYERKAIEQINSGAASGITADSFKAMQNSMIEDYQGGAIWGMKRANFLPVTTLKDSEGRYIFQSRFIDNRDEMRLLGKEIVFMNDMPEVAANALPYAYANFGMGYTIVDRMGFRVIRDNVTRKPYIKFYTTKRTGGAVTNYEAIKIMKIAANP